MFQTLRMDPPVLLQSMAIQANDIKQVIYNRQGSSISMWFEATEQSTKLWEDLKALLRVKNYKIPFSFKIIGVLRFEINL